MSKSEIGLNYVPFLPRLFIHSNTFFWQFYKRKLIKIYDVAFFHPLLQ